MNPHDKSAVLPAVIGGGTYSTKLLGLSIPDWVGVATIVYLLVITVIKIREHLNKDRNDSRD